MPDLPFSFTGEPAVTLYGELLTESDPALEAAMVNVWGWAAAEARKAALAAGWPRNVAERIDAWWDEDEEVMAIGVTGALPAREFDRLEYGTLDTLPTAAVRNTLVEISHILSLRLQDELDHITGYGIGSS